jgi:hypothetical protein
MAHDRNKTAPSWAKDAVASPQGWRNPKTGELLVSYKGLDKVVEAPAPKKSAKKVTKKVAQVELEEVDAEEEKDGEE